MNLRPFWIEKIEKAWVERSIVWLAGVRRTGKTTLSKSFQNALYLNCDLPRVQNELENVELFMKTNRPGTLVFDEIHRLADPAIALKIIADEFPKTKVLATGSSTLTAKKKFKDTLTDRKRTIHFTPVLVQELDVFKATMKTRLLHGGLPPALLSKTFDREFYSEWFDSFYSRDIQEIYEIDKKQPFLKLLELLLIRNGGMTEATEMAKIIGISRPTVIKYVEALESAQAIHVIKPFFSNPEQEIIHQPKIYGFDTGFICHAKDWEELRPDDYGHLFENLVLETMIACGYRDKIRYWRTKNRQEIDFVIPRSKSKGVIAIEVKWNSKTFDVSALRSFRERYPIGENWLICADEIRIRMIKRKELELKVVPIGLLHEAVGRLGMN